MKLTRIPHLDGDPGVAQTIAQMRRLIEQGKQDPKIHELAASILKKANVAAYDWEGEARAIFEAVRRNLRFTRDVDGHETLHAASDIVRLGIGDCDDFTVLVCSLLGTIGAECRIVTVSMDPSGEFGHVYPEVLIGNRWIAVDAARRQPAFGKSPTNCLRKRVWSLETGEFTDMGRLGDGRQSIAPGQGPQGAWRANVYPPFRAPAREMTGTYLSAFPVAPPHQQFKRPPLGHGNYGPAAAARALGDFSRRDRRRAMGDFEDVSSSIANLIGAGTQGAANIIRASNTPGFPILQPGQVPLTAYNASPSFLSTISPTELLIGGGLLLAILAERR